MNFLSKYKFSWMGAGIGAAGGLAYYSFVGCSTGTCAITSSPVNSTLYGALMGFLLFSSFQKENTI
ncbi:MAG: DUF6132 family protein [Chitinophagales bacterium]